MSHRIYRAALALRSDRAVLLAHALTLIAIGVLCAVAAAYPPPMPHSIHTRPATPAEVERHQLDAQAEMLRIYMDQEGSR